MSEGGLFRAWLVMMGLTLISLAAWAAGSGLEASGAWAGLLAMAIAIVKGRRLLDDYLNLAHCPGPWRAGFTLALSLIALLVALAGWLSLGQG